MLFTLSDTRSTWMVYTAFLAVVALLFFADLADLPIDTHDEDYFLDSADTLAAPAARPSNWSFCCNIWPGAPQAQPIISVAVYSTLSPH